MTIDAVNQVIDIANGIDDKINQKFEDYISSEKIEQLITEQISAGLDTYKNELLDQYTQISQQLLDEVHSFEEETNQNFEAFKNEIKNTTELLTSNKSNDLCASMIYSHWYLSENYVNKSGNISQSVCYIPSNNSYIVGYSNNDGSTYSVLREFDYLTGSLLREIQVTPPNHLNSLSYNPDENIIYSCPADTLSGSYAILEINYSNLSVKKIQPTTTNYYSVSYDSTSRQLYCFRQPSSNNVVIDVLNTSYELQSTITCEIPKGFFPSEPTWQGVVYKDGALYQLQHSPNVLIKYSAITGKFIRCWNLPEYVNGYFRVAEPEGLDFIDNNKLIFICNTYSDQFKRTGNQCNLILIDLNSNVISASRYFAGGGAGSSFHSFIVDTNTTNICPNGRELAPFRDLAEVAIAIDSPYVNGAYCTIKANSHVSDTCFNGCTPIYITSEEGADIGGIKFNYSSGVHFASPVFRGSGFQGYSYTIQAIGGFNHIESPTFNESTPAFNILNNGVLEVVGTITPNQPTCRVTTGHLMSARRWDNLVCATYNAALAGGYVRIWSGRAISGHQTITNIPSHFNFLKIGVEWGATKLVGIMNADSNSFSLCNGSADNNKQFIAEFNMFFSNTEAIINSIRIHNTINNTSTTVDSADTLCITYIDGVY